MVRRDFRIRQIWLPGLFGRITSLLLVLSVLTLYFYVIGNAQGFTDETLLVLFSVQAWLLALCAITGVFATISYTATIPLRRRLELGRIVFSALASVVSLILYLGAALLRAFMGGYA